VGLLVLSAWCLSVLNSHRKFFLSVCGAGHLETSLSFVATLMPGGSAAGERHRDRRRVGCRGRRAAPVS
jgi:hypothetical protein